jgi:hypothetical protein
MISTVVACTFSVLSCRSASAQDALGRATVLGNLHLMVNEPSGDQAQLFVALNDDGTGTYTFTRAHPGNALTFIPDSTADVAIETSGALTVTQIQAIRSAYSSAMSNFNFSYMYSDGGVYHSLNPSTDPYEIDFSGNFSADQDGTVLDQNHWGYWLGGPSITRQGLTSTETQPWLMTDQQTLSALKTLLDEIGTLTAEVAPSSTLAAALPLPASPGASVPVVVATPTTSGTNTTATTTTTAASVQAVEPPQ